MAEEKNKALIDEIAKHATIIDYHVGKLRTKPEKLHEIDIELLADKVREVYSLILELRPASIGLNTIPSGSVDEPAADSPDVPETVVNKEPDNVPGPEVEPEPEPEITPEPEPEPEVEPEIEPEVEPEEEPAPVPYAGEEPADEAIVENDRDVMPAEEEPAKPEDPPPADHRPRTTADLFSGTTTIADSYQGKKDNTIASRVVPAGVKDLKKAIGINDKFLFINELFRGDPSVYNSAIDKLNEAGGMAEAATALNTYREEYSWASNSEAYHRLSRIVQSKYAG